MITSVTTLLRVSLTNWTVQQYSRIPSTTIGCTLLASSYSHWINGWLTSTYRQLFTSRLITKGFHRLHISGNLIVTRWVNSTRAWQRRWTKFSEQFSRTSLKQLSSLLLLPISSLKEPETQVQRISIGLYAAITVQDFMETVIMMKYRNLLCVWYILALRACSFTEARWHIFSLQCLWTLPWDWSPEFLLSRLAFSEILSW